MGALEFGLVRGVSFSISLLPAGMGQSALGRRYVSSGRLASEGVHRRKFAGGAVLHLDLGDRTQAEAWFARRYSLEILNYARRSLPRNGIVFDVGANVGLITFPLLAYRPDATVHAFEPSPENVRGWRRNRSLSEAGTAYLVTAAVGSEHGTATLVVPDDSGSGFIRPGSGDVEMLTLDEYVNERGIRSISLLKIDVEGHELDVLRGAEALLAAGRIERVICEINPENLSRVGITEEALEEELAAHGYSRKALPAAGVRGLRGPVTDDALYEVPR